jgi:histidinol phosphatase-like enzyme
MAPFFVEWKGAIRAKRSAGGGLGAIFFLKTFPNWFDFSTVTSRRGHRHGGNVQQLQRSHVSQSAVFIDRPSLLLVESSDRNGGNIQVREDALDGLLQINPNAYRLFFIGNEDSQAFERVPEKKHQKACQQILEALARAGISLVADYTCPYALNAPPAHRKDSVFRIPNVGAMKASRLEFDIHLETSWVVSDRAETMLAGTRSGARTALVRSPNNERRYDVTPDLVADDLGTAMRFLTKLQLAMTR